MAAAEASARGGGEEGRRSAGRPQRRLLGGKLRRLRPAPAAAQPGCQWVDRPQDTQNKHTLEKQTVGRPGRKPSRRKRTNARGSYSYELEFRVELIERCL